MSVRNVRIWLRSARIHTSHSGLSWPVSERLTYIQRPAGLIRFSQEHLGLLRKDRAVFIASRTRVCCRSLLLAKLMEPG